MDKVAILYICTCTLSRLNGHTVIVLSTKAWFFEAALYLANRESHTFIKYNHFVSQQSNQVLNKKSLVKPTLDLSM